ncbi:MAG: hypothetical protein D6773_16300 [Alphaproteobacteria bacterium]|nr:MAG: hypothetical protein D6773_16300 [Alphaproteobacteria bacterium]
MTTPLRVRKTMHDCTIIAKSRAIYTRAINALFVTALALALAFLPVPRFSDGAWRGYSVAWAAEVDLQFLKGTQFLDSNGDPLAGGKLYFYDAGTTSDRTVYSDASGTAALPQPVVLDAAGRLTTSVYIPTGSWKIKVTDANDVTVYTEDNIEGAHPTSTFATGTLVINSPVISKTSNYTVATTDAGKTIACNATGGPVTITLPSASTAGDGFYIGAINVGSSGTCTLTATGGQSINGSTNLQLASQYSSAQLYSDGANWHAFTLSIGDASITSAKLASDVTGQFIQVGSVIPWFGDTCPAGYLEANGQSVSRTTYATLFNKWGTRFGSVDSSSFNVVDLRGEFLRGLSNGSGNDPDAASRTDRGDGVTGDNVGTKQADQFRSHDFHASTNGTSALAAGATGIGLPSGGGWISVGGNETRPRNVATIFCIFASAELSAGASAPLHTILNGAGAPGASTGSDGDFYIDTTNNNIYGPKASGSWGSPTSIVGPAGPNMGHGFNFNSSTTLADPGSGSFLFNNATLSSVTAVAISDNDRNAADVSADILSWDDSTSTALRGVLRFVDPSNTANFAIYSITGASTDNTGWTQLAVTHVASNGSFTNGAEVGITFARTGDKGDTGATGATGPAGPAGPTGASGPVFLDYTWSTATSGDPGSGKILVDNATPASITALHVSETDRNGVDKSALLDILDNSTSATKSLVYIVNVSDPTQYLAFNLTTVWTDAGTYRTATATNGSGAAITNGATVAVLVIPNGDAGAATNSFETVNAPLGTDPVAESGTDTLNLTASAGIDITGSSATDTIDISLDLGDLTEETAPAAGDFLAGEEAGGAQRKFDVSKVGTGKQTIWIPGGAMVATATAGATPETREIAADQPMLSVMSFPTASNTNAQFNFVFPKGANETSTITYQVYWTADAGTAAQTVNFDLSCLARSNDDPLGAAFGTAVASDDALIALNDVHVSPESAALTIGGTPAEGDIVFCQLERDTVDTLSDDAQVIGVKILYTTNANTDD